MSDPQSRDYVALDGMILSCFSGENELNVPTELDGQSMNAIGKGAFSGLNSLKHVRIPGEIRRISSSAFSRCQMLETVELEGSLPEVGDGVLNSCPQLREIRLRELPVSAERYRLFRENSVPMESGLLALERFPMTEPYARLARLADPIPARPIPHSAAMLMEALPKNGSCPLRPGEAEQFRKLILSGAETPRFREAEAENDRLVRRDAEPSFKPTALFCFDDSQTRKTGKSYLLNASVRYGFFFWQSKTEIEWETRSYYLYHRNVLPYDWENEIARRRNMMKTLDYYRMPVGVFDREGPVHDELARQIYAKYQLLCIL